MENIRVFNNYQEMKNTHQQEFNAFPFGFAFSDKQFDEMMKNRGLDPDNDLDKIVRIHLVGGFLRKSDLKAYHELADRFDKEEKLFKQNYKKLVDMLVYEMANHEYCITCDIEETLEACGYSLSDLNENKSLQKAVKEARKTYLQNVDHL